jgi:hypothetical protein
LRNRQDCPDVRDLITARSDDRRVDPHVARSPASGGRAT